MKSKPSSEIALPPGAPKGFIARRVSGTPLTPEQKRRPRDLAAMPDESIDLSDIPEWTEEMWKNAVRMTKKTACSLSPRKAN